MLQKHGVEFDEVVEVLAAVSGAHRVQGRSVDERRYMADGRTQSGRRLCVVFVREQGSRVRIITAYEPQGRKQRRRHGRR